MDNLSATGLVVLGMHRSGTSVLTGALQLSGAWVGEEDELTGTNAENPKGFFERRDMREICDGLLHAAESNWWKLSGFDPDSIPGSALNEHGEAFASVISRLSEHGVWAIKEPRLCLLLPVLRHHLGRAVCVHVFRNPLEVARSLRVRNGFGIAEGIALWEGYLRAAWRASAGMPSVLVSYERLMAAPEATMADLIGSLQAQGVEGLRVPEPAELSGFVTPQLRRQKVIAAETEAQLLPSQRELWRQLQAGEFPDIDELPPIADATRNLLRDLEARQRLRDDVKRYRARLGRDTDKFEAEMSRSQEQLEAAKAALEQARQSHERDKARLAAELESSRKDHELQKGRLEREKERVEREKERVASALAESQEKHAASLRHFEHEMGRRNQHIKSLEARSAALREQLHDSQTQQYRSRAAAVVQLRRRPGPRTRLRQQKVARRLARSGLFDAHWYVVAYPHTASSGLAPLWHWLTAGVHEGLKPNALFEPDWYLQCNEDVRDAGINPLAHYLDSGAAEGRDPGPLFRQQWYLAQYPDVSGAGVNPLVHYLRDGRAEGRRPNAWFDPAWYRTQSWQLANQQIDPLSHYLVFGASEGLWPCPGFDAQAYLARYADVAKAAVNPLWHFMAFGEAEGRECGPPKSPGPAQSAGSAAEDDAAPLVGQHGRLERVSPASVMGWAIDSDAPGQPVALSVFADGAHCLDIATDQARNDITQKLGVDGSCAGFLLELPPQFLLPGSQVEVRFADGEPLDGSPQAATYDARTPAPRRSGYLDAMRDGPVPAVCVVVPVFNAPDAVAECIASLRRYRPAYARVLLINDASTDERIDGILAPLADEPGFEIVGNPENLGYTRTVNRGIELAGGDDVVLLNSDTVVTPRWLDALRYCAYDQARVATVTALSNNAGAFSAPRLGQHTPRPLHLDEDGFARRVIGATPGVALDVPTGNGFCLYIRRAAITALGAFDAERFPRGYGEENDFCMRALRAGWRNLVCDKAYVLHKRSQSFQGEKTELVKQGRAEVDKAFPEYGQLIARFDDVAFRWLRKAVDRALLESGRPRPRVLFVISTVTGGTPQTNLDLMRVVSDRFAPWLLRCDSRRLTLSELVGGELKVRREYELARAIDPVTHQSDEYDQVVSEWLYQYAIELLHIRHIAWHSLNLAGVARAHNIPVACSLHDYYTVCPSLNLLDDENRFCAGRCTRGSGDCSSALWPDSPMPRLKNGFVERWRQMMGAFLSQCDAYITTSDSAARIVEDAFPQLDEGKVEVIPHGRNFPRFTARAQWPQAGEKVRILVPGNIGISKGSEVIRAVAKSDPRFEFHFLGATGGILRDIGVHHGTYRREQFDAKVKDIAPAFGLVFSIWAETYCHTLTEMWASGIPVLGMNLGAVGDRIGKSGGGWLIDHRATPQAIIQRFEEILADRADYEQRLEAVKAWQSGEGHWNDTATMAFRYRQIYGRLLPGENHARKRLGLLHKWRPYVPATAHIRLLLPWGEAATSAGHDVRSVGARWLLSGGDQHIDALVIQRDAVPADLVDPLLQQLAERGIPYIYEIDDALWDLPADHPDKSRYADSEDSIIALIKGASRVTTTTDALASRLASMNARVQVLPTAHPTSLWCAPLDGQYVEQVLQDCELTESGVQRILYMGTNSHQADLEMIEPALLALRKTHPNLEFIQIGGGRPLAGARVLDVPKSASDYLKFVAWFRSVCTAATLAVAPLRDIAFNDDKSDVKLLDYAMAGLPGVYSRVGPYRNSVVDGETGLLAENETDSWVRQIGRLLDDATLRDHIRNKARSWVLDRPDETRPIVADLLG